MHIVHRVVGAGLVLLAVLVAVYFVATEYDVVSSSFALARLSWSVLNYLMAIGIVLGVVFAWIRKRAVEARGLSNEITRPYLEANVLFYAFMFTALLFFWNWFDRLAGGDVFQDSVTRRLAWIMLDAIFPLITGAMGMYLWRGGSDD